MKQQLRRTILAVAPALLFINAHAPAQTCDGVIFPGPVSDGGADPRLLLFEHFNTDGFMDVLTFEADTRQISVRLGQGDGSFRPRITYGGLLNRLLATGDQDGDGDNDLFSMSSTPFYTWRLNTGSGVLPFGPSGNLEVYPLVVDLRDMNGDGADDLIVCDLLGTLSVGVYVNDGQGGFTTAQRIPLEHEVSSFLFADLDGDGDDDIVTRSRVASAAAILINEGGGSLSRADDITLDDGVLDIAVNDVDGDSVPDVVILEDSNEVSLYVGDGAGGFLPPRLIARLSSAPTIDLGDANGDGLLDLFTSEFSSSRIITVRLGNGSGGFASPARYASRGGDVVAIDLTANGRSEIVTYDSQLENIHVLVGRKDGTYPGRTSSDLALESAHAVSIRDVNGDGELDALVLHRESFGQLSTLLGDGTGAFTQAGEVFCAVNPADMAVGDLDGDGDPDVAVTSTNRDEVTFMINDGAGTFTSLGAVPTGDEPVVVELIDIDGDADLDAVTTCMGGQQIVLALNDGSGSFAAQPPHPLPYEPTASAIGDLDGDGLLDAAVIWQSRREVAILLGVGLGQFAPPTTYATQDTPFEIELADLDGDGNLDVVVSTGDASIESFRGQGDGTLLPRTTTPTWRNRFALDLQVQDINGDEAPDALVNIVGTLPGRRGLAVFLGNGNATFDNLTRYDTTFPASALDVADVTSDGKPDIIAVSGTTIDGIETLPNLCPDPCRPDFDGDGDLTIFDFLAFQTLFAAGSTLVDFDGDGELSIFDFLAFQNAFDIGCP